MPTEAETRLAEARLALHSLVTGGQIVQLRHGDQWEEYSPAKRADLEAYIRALELETGSGSPYNSRRPFGVAF
jgi:hypothetical protein